MIGILPAENTEYQTEKQYGLLSKKYGLLGYPLGHSVSAYIHRRIFEMCGISGDCEYELYEIEPEELSLKVGAIKELHGFNVTIPYKTRIIEFIARLDHSAERYGAVNCVKFSERDGEYIGYNTDGYGFLKSVESLGAPLGGRVLLLGCGGTARMMAIEAVAAGAELTLAIRRSDSAMKAAAALSREINDMLGQFYAKTAQLNLNSKAKMKITYIDQLNLVNEYDLLLNATPCGMFPDVESIPLNPIILSKVKYLFDAVYNPEPTLLITEAEKRGVKAIGGISMLVHQAVQAERIWNDVEITDEQAGTIIGEVRALIQESNGRVNGNE